MVLYVPGDADVEIRLILKPLPEPTIQEAWLQLLVLVLRNLFLIDSSNALQLAFLLLLLLLCLLLPLELHLLLLPHLKHILLVLMDELDVDGLADAFEEDLAYDEVAVARDLAL